MPSRSDRGVLCAECDHLNPADRETCRYCSKSLFVTCAGCSIRNERVLSQCRKCGRSLPSGFLSGLLGSSAVDIPGPSRRAGTPSGSMGRGTLCSKCEHLNPADLEQCERCSQPLFIDCPKCRKRNARVIVHCVSCRSRLHRRSSHGGSHADGGSRPAARPPLQNPMSNGPVVCAKCTHPNPPGLQRCEQCRGHLFVVCRDCNTTNARSEPRCLKCNRRLHRSINERLDPLGAKAVSMKWFYAMVAILLLALAGFILVHFSGLRIFE